MAGTLHRALLNRYALGTALTLVVAPFAGIDRAMAACTPPSGQDNVTVTCGSNTTNQDGTNGYGQGIENGVTVNVNAGVTVSGTDTGIALSPAGNPTTTLNNSGTVTGGTGYQAGNNVIVTNAGNITGTTFSAIETHSILTLTNSGAISGATNGVFTPNVNLTNLSTGTIDGEVFGMNASDTLNISNAGAIRSGGGAALKSFNATIVSSNTGTISGLTFGIDARQVATITNNVGGLIEAVGVDGVAIGSSDSTPANTVTLANAGTVAANSAGGFAVLGQTINVTSNTGTISAGSFAVSATDSATVNNAGTISGGSNGIVAGNSATVTNTGTGSITGAVGISATTVSVNNAGGITGTGFAIEATSATVTNLAGGTIQASAANGFAIGATNTATIANNAGGTISATGANGVAIGSSGLANTVTLTNAGMIQANGTNGFAILGQTVNVTSNTGTISSDSTAVRATDTATVNNAGTISTGVNGFGISAPTANVINTGTIVGGSNGRGLNTGIANVTNFGIISGGVGIDSPTLTVMNAGQVLGGVTGAGIQASNANITNSGVISGKFAIQDNGPTTITNSGTIRSTDGAAGTAIQLSNASDTLNIKNGSSIIGLIDMGHGADVINVDSTTPSSKGVSMLSRATSAVVDALEQQLRNFDGVINIIGGGNAGGQPTVTVNGQTASLDPTALAQQDRTLMDFTGGMSSMVQGRLGGAATGAGPMAMSYAMEDARAEMFSKAPAASWNAPVNVWSSAFGASRSQNGTDTTLDSTSSVYGGVIGVDRRIRPDWLIGAFAGGGSGTLNVDLGSQKLSTDYFSAGAYSRFEWDAQFIDMTLQAGGINNRSTRLVQNNITGGNETATASYNGWFVSPEVAYGYHIDLGNGTMVTPTARVRYVAGLFGGYTEAGSAQTLTIGSRTLQDFEERGEVEVSKTGFLGDAALKGTLHGGVIALQRVGDSTVNAVLIGQNLSFITPGRSSAVGAVGGVSLDYHVTPNVALFGAVEGMMMSDESRIGSAKGGVRVAF